MAMYRVYVHKYTYVCDCGGDSFPIFIVSSSTMKYHSTRGGHKGMTFEEAVFSGFLSDGGILLPEDIPKVTQEQMTSWAKMSYLEILRNIITLFVDESEMSRHDVNCKWVPACSWLQSLHMLF